jgi:hypothetical protein
MPLNDLIDLCIDNTIAVIELFPGLNTMAVSAKNLQVVHCNLYFPFCNSCGPRPNITLSCFQSRVNVVKLQNARVKCTTNGTLTSKLIEKLELPKPTVSLCFSSYVSASLMRIYMAAFHTAIQSIGWISTNSTFARRWKPIINKALSGAKLSNRVHVMKVMVGKEFFSTLCALSKLHSTIVIPIAPSATIRRIRFICRERFSAVAAWDCPVHALSFL